MSPQVRVYSDPFEGLELQLTELRGLIKIVPPLIEADRERRWREIGERPSDGEDDEIIDVYQAEAGPEEGWGFADFGRTIRVAAVVFGWAVFQDYLAHELRDYLAHELNRSYPTYNLAPRALTVLVDEDVRRWDRRFDDLKKRYEDFAGIAFKELPSWHQVLHAQELRNALVHSQSQYTQRYLNTNLAYRPTKEDLPFRVPGDAGLIDREVIPLSCTLADAVISQLRVAATEVREAIEHARRGGGGATARRAPPASAPG
jgi:hypothetical protein